MAAVDGRAIAADLKPQLEASYPAIKEGDFAAFEAFAGNFADEVVERMAKQVQEVEQSIREAVPQASQVDIEPTVGDDE